MSKVHDHYAFPDNPVIEAVMRLGSVKRWHMLDATRTQTLAEHSANVSLLAYALTVTAPGMYFGPASEVAAYALLHDVPEVFTGDPPTPTKQYLQGLKELEAKVTPAALRRVATSKVELLTKICDVADGWRFIRLHGVGATAHHAVEGIRQQFQQLGDKAVQEWPAEVASHVIEGAWFYANETRIGSSAGIEIKNGEPVAPDLARGQGDRPGGPGHQLRDAGLVPFTNPSYTEWYRKEGARNRLAGTEGGEPENYGGSS